MSAVLSTEDLQPVADLLEQVQNVQRAMCDLHDEFEAGGGDFFVEVLRKTPYKQSPIAHTHHLTYGTVMQGLAAMERELIAQLQAKEITVQSALPMKEHA
jgi:hypothetical protein